jgi:hypothetical protein
MAAAAVSEPAVYRPEMSVRDHPVSRSIGPTNTDTTYVCPGLETKTASIATLRMTHP